LTQVKYQNYMRNKFNTQKFTKSIQAHPKNSGSMIYNPTDNNVKNNNVMRMSPFVDGRYATKPTNLQKAVQYVYYDNGQPQGQNYYPKQQPQKSNANGKLSQSHHV